MAETMKYKCMRCGHAECTIGSLYAASGVWSKILDVEGSKFSTVTCDRCKHTELFKAGRSALESIFDLFVT